VAVAGLILASLPGARRATAARPVRQGATGSTGVGTEPPAPEAIPLEVFVYNVEYGGDESTDAVIRCVDADIVGVLESYNRLPEIAANTGYPYYNVSLQLLSKYPIHEPSGPRGATRLIEVRPGEVVAFFNIHLDYVKYGPKLLSHGARSTRCSRRRTRCARRSWTSRSGSWAT
jgi:hypothetical protein